MTFDNRQPFGCQTIIDGKKKLLYTGKKHLTIFSKSSTTTYVPEIQVTRNTSYLTASKSLNDQKIARMARILTIFGPNRSQRRDLFFEEFSNERRRHRGIVVVVVIVAVVVAALAVVGDFR